MKSGFDQFLSFFPEIDLPITLNDEIQLTFSRQNKPLPMALSHAFLPGESTDMDEYLEFVPCFQLASDGQYYVIVYWQATLMEYKYVMSSFSKNGHIISKKTLGGTVFDGTKVTQAVATIDAERAIHVVQGSNDADSPHYDPGASIAVHFEIQDDGQISQI